MHKLFLRTYCAFTIMVCLKVSVKLSKTFKPYRFSPVSVSLDKRIISEKAIIRAARD